MKKILFVSSLQIFPPQSGGQLRSANLCRAFVKLGYEVEVYSLTGRREDYLARKGSFAVNLQEGLREFVNMNPFWGLLQMLSYRYDLPPLWVTWLLKIYTPRGLKQRIQNADLVVLDFPFLYPLFAKVSGVKWLNTHNAEFELWANRQGIGSMVREIELNSFESAEKILFCSERDQEKFLNDMPTLSQKSAIVSNGVELEQFQFAKDLREKTRKQLGIASNQKMFLFTGSSYEPNQEAFQFLRNFAKENQQVLTDGGAVIVVAGTVSHELVNETHFKVLGKVPEMAPYFAAADFGLNPIVKGSGVNVKMIEFIAARLPILSTEFGLRGLEFVDQESCFTFDRADLLKTLAKVLPTSESVKQKVTAKAFQDNEVRVDMTRALGNLFNNSSLGMGS